MTDGVSSDRPRERADAARNRRAILDATATLLAEHGAASITMDRVAAAAGVGKGTIFHRFGNRAGLLRELLGERAFTLMDDISNGPPPLGPGAPPAERLIAYFDAMTRLVIDNVELIIAYNTIPPHPRRDEVHAFWAAHITSMLRAARPDIDAEAVGSLLLAPLGGELVPQMIREGQGERLLAAMRELVESVLRAP
ncbi:TetR/AcrR family transcriptional regulator [Nocardia sp. NBC_00565]|uniref:TetR/AcrR family transcriptional regulator n=1 Tax=Nocardia sp. NBC_00565 TaxID=2975993 RepID=UPI002E82240E|nr:helix-turn-helix domain-containing protein [Nocardia sp. NBC_00565]WUC07144.1 TetR/AcrR family transcriptional regulator [Nocardia sp. NBC_00565]